MYRKMTVEYYLPKTAYLHMPLKHKAAMQYYDKGLTVFIWQTEILLENLIVYFLHLHHDFMHGGCNINHAFTTTIQLWFFTYNMEDLHHPNRFAMQLFPCAENPLRETHKVCWRHQHLLSFCGYFEIYFFSILTRTGIFFFFSNWGRIHSKMTAWCIHLFLNPKIKIGYNLQPKPAFLFLRFWLLGFFYT